jgi:trigger factor
MTGPEAHEIEELRGAPIHISYRLATGERIEPAPIQAMIDKYSLGTEENVLQQIRLALEHQRDAEQAAAMREQVSQHLLESVEVELPARLTAAQAARNLEGHRLDLLYRGVPAEEIEQRLAAIRADTEQQTQNRLKLFFIMRRLADAFDVQATEQEVNGRITEIALQHGQRPDQLRAELQRTGRLGEIARMVREHKTADRIVEKAKIKEIAAEEWNELVRQGKDVPRPGRSKTPRKQAAAPAEAAAGDEDPAPEKATSSKPAGKGDAAKKPAGKPRSRK